MEYTINHAFPPFFQACACIIAKWIQSCTLSFSVAACVSACVITLGVRLWAQHPHELLALVLIASWLAWNLWRTLPEPD